MTMNKEGRPPIYENPDEMQKDINRYFNKCIEVDKPKTVAGLANALGMTRKTLSEYQKKDEFCNTVEKAKQTIESEINEKGLSGDYVAQIVKFNLKNNFDWEDRKKEEITGKGGGPVEVDTGLDITIHEAREYESDDELDDAQQTSGSVE